MAATYTVKQVAEILGYSTNSIYTFLKEKRLKGVRVGKGRFRIPQSELDRLLLTSKGQTGQSPSVQTILATQKQVPTAGVSDVASRRFIDGPRFFGNINVGTLNIFDWFIGTAAMIAGLGLFLFNTSFAKPTQSSEIILSIIRSILIGAGIGIIVTNITGRNDRIWHKIFHGMLGIMSLGMGMRLLQSGEIDGALIYGSLAILIFLSMIIRMGGIAWVSLYISMLTISMPISLLFAQRLPHLKGLLLSIPVSPVVFSVMVSISGALFLVSLWWGYVRNKHLFWFTTWVAAFLYFVLAFWYATDQYWSRSFFFLVVGMTSLFLSPWEKLMAIRSHKANLFTIWIFIANLAVLLFGLVSVYFMQINVLATIKRENVYKVQYAKSEIERSIEDIIAALEGAAANREFIAAVVRKDLSAINEAERFIYENNSFIRRLILLSAEGQGINLYPFGTFDRPDFSTRDYFVAVRDRRQPFVSDLFEAASDQSRRQVISIAVPLVDAHDNFVGLLAASLDLNGLSAQLQKIAVPERGEYVVAVDSFGRRIIHPDSKLIAKEVPSSDPVLLGTDGNQGVGAGDMSDGTSSIVAYEPITVRGVRWGVAIKSPMGKIYKLTDSTNLSIFAIITAAVVIAGIVLHGGFYWRRILRIRGGSP